MELFKSTYNPKSENNINVGHNVIRDGEIIFYPDFFSEKESDHFLRSLIDTIAWRQDSMNLYGKMVNFPRLTSWYGAPGKIYSFSGNTLSPLPWTKQLIEIKDKINAVAKVKFNSVLLNRYRIGSDWISWHQDNERELGKNPVIGSVNFGATRKFQIRHLKTREKITIELKHGSLLVMAGELQHNWQHQVPKMTRQIGERLNLTFRVIY